MRWDAIVIGSGVGGSVTAALLADAGLRVLVVEKNPVPGGILASRTREGFKMDVGSHLVARGAKGPLGQVLRRLGLDHPRFLTHPIPVRSRGIFECTLPASRWGLPRVAVQAARDLGVPPREAIALATFVMRLLATRGSASLDRRNMDELLRRWTDHPGAYFLLSFLASIFFVLPPWEVSAGEALLALRSVIRDWSLSYVEGGMDAYTKALLDVVRSTGGGVLTGRAVTRIAPGPKSISVLLDGGSVVEAPFVAANLAPADLLALLENVPLPSDWEKAAESVRASGNAWQLKLALSRPLVDEGCLIGGISLRGMRPRDLTFDLFRETVASLEAGRITDPLPVYAPVPSNFDRRLAPAGMQLIVASVFGARTAAPVDSTAAWEKASLDAMRAVIPGLDDALVFHEFSSIRSIGNWMGKSACGAIANGQFPGQTGADRLPVATPVRGLFLCGDGAGGRGIGMELAATSAMEVVDAILRRREGREPEAPILAAPPQSAIEGWAA